MSTRGARPGRGGSGEGHARLVHVGAAVHAVGGWQGLGADDAVEAGGDVGRERVRVGGLEEVAVARVHQGPPMTHVVVGVEAPQGEGARAVGTLEPVDEVEFTAIGRAETGADLGSERLHVVVPEDLRVARDESRHDHGPRTRIGPKAGLVDPRVVHGDCLGRARARKHVDEASDEETGQEPHRTSSDRNTRTNRSYE